MGKWLLSMLYYRAFYMMSQQPNQSCWNLTLLLSKHHLLSAGQVSENALYIMHTKVATSIIIDNITIQSYNVILLSDSHLFHKALMYKVLFYPSLVESFFFFRNIAPWSCDLPKE